MPWYIYNPTGTPPYNIGGACNYNPVGSSPPSCAGPNNYLCGIQANDIGGKPIITQALILEIAEAVNNKTETTNVVLRSTITI
jgi:hypothetical protein